MGGSLSSEWEMGAPQRNSGADIWMVQKRKESPSLERAVRVARGCGFNF